MIRVSWLKSDYTGRPLLPHSARGPVPFAKYLRFTAQYESIWSSPFWEKRCSKNKPDCAVFKKRKGKRDPLFNSCMNLQGNVSNHFQMEEFAGVSQIHQKAWYIKEWHYVPKALCVPDCYCLNTDPLQTSVTAWRLSTKSVRSIILPQGKTYKSYCQYLCNSQTI